MFKVYVFYSRATVKDRRPRFVLLFWREASFRFHKPSPQFCILLAYPEREGGPRKRWKGPHFAFFCSPQGRNFLENPSVLTDSFSSGNRRPFVCFADISPHRGITFQGSRVTKELFCFLTWRADTYSYIRPFPRLRIANCESRI